MTATVTFTKAPGRVRVECHRMACGEGEDWIPTVLVHPVWVGWPAGSQRERYRFLLEDGYYVVVGAMGTTGAEAWRVCGKHATPTTWAAAQRALTKERPHG